MVSDCHSWMLEDLEGPVNRPSDHARKMLETIRSLTREKRKRKGDQQQHNTDEGTSKGEE